MLSYQHIYHAGNMADVQKHALLAWVLDYMTRKDKPLTYLESHAGRGLYDLTSAEAVKTGEAAKGIALAQDWFPADHPYSKALAKVRAEHGPNAYPGSPLIAASLLREMDNIRVAELHPREFEALAEVMRGKGRAENADGLELALSITPPEPRRGILLIDPSFEVKDDYARLPGLIANINRKWPVGVIMLWYPLLTGDPHKPMLRALEKSFPDGLRHEVRFPPAREGHRMVGSGLFVVNPPWGLSDECARLGALFAKTGG